jgi:hypothetical protein
LCGKQEEFGADLGVSDKLKAPEDTETVVNRESSFGSYVFGRSDA